MDDKLNWRPHIKNLKSKLARTCYTFYKLKKYVNQHTLKMLYYSLVYPHLQYCITSWGKAAEYLISKIFVMQKYFIKTICNKGSLEQSTPLFLNLEMLKLNDIYKLQVGKLMYKVKNETLIGNNTLIKTSEIHNYNTRLAGSLNYFIPQKRTCVGKRSFSFNGPKIWQNIPLEIKNSTTGCFKYKLKKLLLDSYNNV